MHTKATPKSLQTLQPELRKSSEFKFRQTCLQTYAGCRPKFLRNYGRNLLQNSPCRSLRPKFPLNDACRIAAEISAELCMRIFGCNLRSDLHASALLICPQNSASRISDYRISVIFNMQSFARNVC